ncbi:MAG: hypothetical protein ABI791_09030 [Acidobacteriota bacterium]
MGDQLKTAIRYSLQPLVIIYFVALFNFVWFFSQSWMVESFLSKKISFCVVCPWWWDWSFTNATTFSLIATIFLLVGRWRGYLAACLFSGYQVIVGFSFISGSSGIFGGLSRRFEIVAESNAINVWELPDVQYVFALIVFITAIVYFAMDVTSAKGKAYVS